MIALDGEAAAAEWATVLDAGGAVAWTGTLYDVDARTYFLLAFDLRGILKVNLHGASGDWEVYKPVGEDYPAIRGRGPAGFQDLVRRTLVSFVDPERRIALPPLRPAWAGSRYLTVHNR